MYQDLSTRRDWPVKKAIVDLPIRMKGNSKLISGNSLSPLGAQNEDIGTAGARFSKVPITKGRVKLMLFTCNIEVSTVLHLTIS